jgi:uroporphyrinogen-III decarboxylase
MNRRQRLMATLNGRPVDRVPVSFYEISGLEDPTNNSPFNIFSHPSWKPLIELAREKTDRIVQKGVAFKDVLPDPVDNFAKVKTTIKGNSRYAVKTVKIGNKTLTSRTRQDMDVNTVWTEEHLLKNIDDLKLFLQIPFPQIQENPDIAPILDIEEKLGDSGIVMIDTPDPLCLASMMFDVTEYTIIASSEPGLFNQLLEKFAEYLMPQTQKIAKLLPGHLWRIYGPEYASVPFLHPKYFKEFVVRYDKPMVDVIQQHEGFARIHSHGNLKDILDDIVSMGCMGLDPIEPPPQGDVSLAYVRERWGDQLVLFGNLEISDIETLPTDQLSDKVKQAIDEGTAGNGRGFVLMPSACPYGRNLSSLTLRNYEKIIEIVESQ